MKENFWYWNLPEFHTIILTHWFWPECGMLKGTVGTGGRGYHSDWMLRLECGWLCRGVMLCDGLASIHRWSFADILASKMMLYQYLQVQSSFVRSVVCENSILIGISTYILHNSFLNQRFTNTFKLMSNSVKQPVLFFEENFKDH